MFKFTLSLTWRAMQGNHISFLLTNDNSNARDSGRPTDIAHSTYRNVLIVIYAYTSYFGITGMICWYYRVSFNEK